MLLRDSFADCRTVYVNTLPGLGEKSGVDDVYVVVDCNRDKWLSNLRCVFQLCKIVMREKPDVVLSTGAAPGLLGLILGKSFGARTVWIDSVANSEKLSLSGKLAGKLCDLWITQWSHLAHDGGPRYYGSVL